MIDDVGIDAKHSFQDNVIAVTRFKKKYGCRLAVLWGIDMVMLARWISPTRGLKPYCCLGLVEYLLISISCYFILIFFIIYYKFLR